MTRFVRTLAAVAAAACVSLSVSRPCAAGDSLGPYVGLKVYDAFSTPQKSNIRQTTTSLASERRGSGVVVGSSASGGWFVLTNAHVVECFDTSATPAPNVYLGGAWRSGRVLGRDREADLALVLVRAPETLRIAKIAAAPPADGERVATRAFAAGTKWTIRSAPLRHALPLEDGRSGHAPHTYFVKTKFRPGESGGAVISEGELVGLIYGNDLSNNWGLCVDHPSIVRFLGRWGWKPGMYSGSTLRLIESPPEVRRSSRAIGGIAASH